MGKWNVLLDEEEEEGGKGWLVCARRPTSGAISAGTLGRFRDRRKKRQWS